MSAFDWSSEALKLADTQRTGLKDLLPTLQEGDTLMVWKLDRHRRALQRDIEKLRRTHAQNRRILARDIAQTMRMA